MTGTKTDRYGVILVVTEPQNVGRKTVKEPIYPIKRLILSGTGVVDVQQYIKTLDEKERESFDIGIIHHFAVLPPDEYKRVREELPTSVRNVSEIKEIFARHSVTADFVDPETKERMPLKG